MMNGNGRGRRKKKPKQFNKAFRFNRLNPNGGDQSWTAPAENEGSLNPEKPPPGLRGKEIGLFYRDRRRKMIEAGTLPPRNDEIEMNFSIPAPLVVQVNNILSSLEGSDTVEKPRFGLEIAPCSSWSPNSTEMKSVDKELLQKDFISLHNTKKENNEDFKSSMQPPPFRINLFKPISNWKVQDYKYAYEDINSASFEEKLEESLCKGITINAQNSDIESMNKEYQLELQNKIRSKKYRDMLKFREKLPTYKKADEIFKILEENQVFLISGETGCGKSTQVPQLILDNAMQNGKGANTKILVTEPRRIAASSLATRVCDERDEELGHSVGYTVRLEGTPARSRGSIMYCTTGVLIVQLQTDQSLSEYSHIILDEAHERDTHIDLTMMMLKMVMAKRKDLKVILMSATLNAEVLSKYFNNCPIYHIEGLTFPVKDIYMEEILHMIHYKMPGNFMSGGNTNKRKEFLEKQMRYQVEIGPWLYSKRSTLSSYVFEILKDIRVEIYNNDLILHLLIYICHNLPPGAVLIFVPGINEITTLLKLIDEQPNSFPTHKYEIYPLHSKLPSQNQRQIFSRPPDGVRKIIIATNIAETSITVDDVVYVIDSCKIKMSGLDVQKYLSTLETQWIAKTNLMQRRGRAGRVQPGQCFHLMTSWRAAQLPEQHLPELQRSNLLEDLLTMKSLRLGKAADALAKAPDPPDSKTISDAVINLQRCGALDADEKLTPLGWHLSRIPVPPAAGKLLIFGALFGCLEKAACIAAVWGFKDPFILTIDKQKEKEADAAKKKLAAGEPSDHIAICNAILTWEDSYNPRQFAFKHYLSHFNCQLLTDMMQQFARNLVDIGFLQSDDLKSEWENRNASNESLFKAVVAAALYPNIAMVRWTGLFKSKQKIRVRTPEDNQGVDIHPGSVMAIKYEDRYRGTMTLCEKPGAKWLVYRLKQKSTSVYLHEVTLVHTLPLLFFCDDLKYTELPNDPENCTLSILNVKVKCPVPIGSLLVQLRGLLDRVLAADVSGNSSDPLFRQTVLKAVIALITAEDEQLDTYDFEDEPDAGTSSLGQESNVSGQQNQEDFRPSKYALDY